METNGPLGTLWVGIGLCAFYLALIWVNTLLGIFLTPLFIIPGTWLMDRLGIGRRKDDTVVVDRGEPVVVERTVTRPER